jgi:hypothetical protein
MSRFILSIFFGLVLTNSASAQTFLEISTGPGYQNQQFINLQTKSLKSVKLTDWDIAFTSFSQQDAGVHFNEASGTSMGQALPEIEVYDAKTSDFSKTIVLDDVKDSRIYNDEKSWSYGAFNSARNAASPLDFGWGKYVPASNQVVGDKVFVIKLKTGKAIKFMIESLTGAGYKFKYADLNGSNEVTKTVAKTPGAQKLLYFSFEKQDLVDIAPAGAYDLVYTRYTSLAQDPNSPLVAQYNVTGIMTAPGNSTARIVSNNPSEVKLTDTTTFTKRQDVIGYDWKTFSNAWSIDDRIVYFVKASVGGTVYRLQMVDFEGGSTGNATIQYESVFLSKTADNSINTVGLFPNPATAEITIVMDVNEDIKNAKIEITDMLGRTVQMIRRDLSVGLQNIPYNVSELQNGMYLVNIYGQKGLAATQKFIKN